MKGDTEMKELKVKVKEYVFVKTNGKYYYKRTYGAFDLVDAIGWISRYYRDWFEDPLMDGFGKYEVFNENGELVMTVSRSGYKGTEEGMKIFDVECRKR